MSDTFDETAIDYDTPTPLPGDVMPSEEPFRPENDLPLHLRVVKAIVEVDPAPERLDLALLLANEIYELEENVEPED